MLNWSVDAQVRLAYLRVFRGDSYLPDTRAACPFVLLPSRITICTLPCYPIGVVNEWRSAACHSRINHRRQLAPYHLVPFRGVRF